MRPQHNNKRGRGRNRRHGGNMGGGGGNANNRVLDSNGPDVKLRGTAQTIAEKYMQLARDAASSGDTVMAESYFQHADHYYRVWLAAQPPGQPIQFSRRLAEDELQDDEIEGAEGEDEAAPEGESHDGAEAATAAEAAGEGGEAPAGGDNQQRQPRQQREFRDNNREQRENREGGNGRERFRPRWPRRNDRYENREGGNGNGQYVEGQGESGERPERNDRPERAERPERFERRERPTTEERGEAGETGDWEAPSFLKRPVPAVAEGEGGAEAPPAEVRKPRGRRPRQGDDAAPEVTSPQSTED